MYSLTILFTGGTLEGLTHTSEVRDYRAPGTRVPRPYAGSPYVIVSCDRIS